jgi:hypothetical protein
MDNGNDVIELLDILYGMVNEAWGFHSATTSALSREKRQ